MKLYYLVYTYETGVVLNDFEVLDYSGGVVSYRMAGLVLDKMMSKDVILDESSGSDIHLWLLSAKSLLEVYSVLNKALNKKLSSLEASITDARTYLCSLSNGFNNIYKIVTVGDLRKAILAYPDARIYYDGVLYNDVFVGTFDCDIQKGNQDIISRLQGIHGVDSHLCAFKNLPFSLQYDGKNFQIIKEG